MSTVVGKTIAVIADHHMVWSITCYGSTASSQRANLRPISVLMALSPVRSKSGSRQTRVGLVTDAQATGARRRGLLRRHGARVRGQRSQEDSASVAADAVIKRGDE